MEGKKVSKVRKRAETASGNRWKTITNPSVGCQVDFSFPRIASKSIETQTDNLVNVEEDIEEDAISPKVIVISEDYVVSSENEPTPNTANTGEEFPLLNNMHVLDRVGDAGGS